MLSTLKALSDATRLRLVAVLCSGEFTVQELTSIMAMGQSRISRHLRILAEAGILQVKRQGTWSYYRVGRGSDFFNDIHAALEKRFAALPERERDRQATASTLEVRRRRSLDFFNRHARNWEQLSRQALPLPDYHSALLDLIPPSSTLLEVGVGTGSLLSSLTAKAKAVVGVDHAPAMLAEAGMRVDQEGHSGVELRLGEMTHLPLRDSEVDTAVLNMVLHHAAAPEAVLAELWRVIRSGGVLVIADLVRHQRDWVRERLADQWLGFTEDELSGWLVAAGFYVEEFSAVDGGDDAVEVFFLKALKPH